MSGRLRADIADGEIVMSNHEAGAQRSSLLALQTIVSYVFAELAKVDPKLSAAIKKGFDEAAMSAEVLALKGGKGERGRSALIALDIIEEFRAITFNEPKKK
jgi:hypothetical protein